MKIIVDAYNLFHLARARIVPQGSLTLGGFIIMIDRWARRAKSDVLLVFDGARPRAIGADLLDLEAVRVTFVGPEHSADSVIIEFIETYSAARTLLIVSSDNEIRRPALRRRCKVLKSEQFWPALIELLNRPHKPREPREKHAGLTDDQTDYWLEEFGLD